MSEEDASIRKNILPVHHVHYLLIQNLIYLTSMSMNIFMCKEAVNIELSQEGIPSDFLDDIPIGNLLEDFDTTKKRDVFYESNFNFVHPEEVTLGKKKIMSMSNRKTKSCGKG